MAKRKTARHISRRRVQKRRNALVLIAAGAALVLISALLVRGSRPAAEPLAAADMIDLGAQLYAQNCAACHGENGSGHVVPEAPALNGSEHAWHHADGQLQRTILNGGQIMPPFSELLSEQEAAAIIRFIQTWWQDDQLRSQQSISLQDPIRQ